MILTLLFNLIYAVLHFLIGFLPVSNGLPTVFFTSATLISTTVDSWLVMMSPLLDNVALSYCVLFLIGLEITLWTIKFAIWLVSHTRIIKPHDI